MFCRSAESKNNFSTCNHTDSCNYDGIAECLTLDENKNPIFHVPNSPKVDKKLTKMRENHTSGYDEYVSPSAQTLIKSNNADAKRESTNLIFYFARLLCFIFNFSNLLVVSG